MNERVAGLVDGDVDLAALEEERDFLLRSLRDLDAEHDAGDIDDVDYETLRDDYTVRTAVVLRALEQADSRCRPAGRGAGGSVRLPGRGRRPGAPRGLGRRFRSPRAGTMASGRASTGRGARPGAGAAAAAAAARRTKTRWRLAAIVMSVLLFGVIAGWAVTATSGSRVSGQSITGNSNLRSPTPAPTPSAVDSSLAKAAGLVTDRQGRRRLEAVRPDPPSRPRTSPRRRPTPGG